MRKYTVAGLALILGTVLAIASSATAQVKIGTVDLQRVRSEDPSFKKALADIDGMVSEFEKRRDRQQAELQSLAQDLQDAQQRGTGGSTERLQSELQQKSADFQKFMTETFGDSGIVETNSSEQLAPLYDKLAAAAKSIAKVQGLDLILDLETVNPLFADDRLDVTDAVLAEFAKLR